MTWVSGKTKVYPMTKTFSLNLNFVSRKRNQTKITLFIFQIIVKIRIHHQTRSRTLYKLIYREIFYPAFFLCACERIFETASFCLKFWLFSSRRPRKLILSIFSKSKRPFEKQTTPRLVTYLYLSMDKIWAKMIFWLRPRNFDFARFLQTFASSSQPFLGSSRNAPSQ